MKIISWNVNGLRAAVKKDFIGYLKTENPDIIGLQETKLQEEQIPIEILELEGYYKYWNSAERKGYSGVAIFSKTEPIKVSYDMGIERFDKEGRFILTEFDNFQLINCYFPNGQKDDERLQYKLDFYDRMLEIMDEIVKSGKNVIVCGDYNTAHKEIDLAHPKENEKFSGFLPIERAWIDTFIDHGYVDTFRFFNKEPNQYTWWDMKTHARERNVGWRIDYFFVNKEFLPKVKKSFILSDIYGSDHCPIGIELVDQL